MAYGLTNKGFVIKRLIDIKEELEIDFKSVLGEGINIEENSPLGQIIGIIAERLSLLWEQDLSIYNSQYPDTAEDVSLDNCAAIVGVPRLEPTKSTAIIRARGSVGTLIPQGRIISVNGNPSVRFITDEDGIIASAVNAIQQITFSLLPDSGTWSITFDGETTALLNYDDDASAIETAIENLSNIEDVDVSGNYTDGFTIEFINADGNTQQVPFEIESNLLAGIENVDVEVIILDEGGAYIDIPCTCEETGANQAPSMTLTEIETLVAGWDECYNLLDALIGRDEETDELYRLRRQISLQRSNTSTVEAIRSILITLENVIGAIVLENDGMVTDIYGRPPKSFEVVIEGGDEDEIAETIWNSKPAGIETYGTIIKIITDSQGIDHTIKFSRPTNIDIYVDITITPQTGITITEQQIKDTIINFGNNLKFGEDVIIYPDFIAAFSGLGIIDIELDIGTSYPPSGDDNIIINPDEKARFDTSNITVTIL